MRERVEEALKKIRPALEADGGGIELVDIVDGVVSVRLKGACKGCPGAQMTMKMGVEKSDERSRCRKLNQSRQCRACSRARHGFSSLCNRSGTHY